jgi:mono/diheme cytochrome c family protein
MWKSAIQCSDRGVGDPAVTPPLKEAELISQAQPKPYRYTKLAFVSLLAALVLSAGVACRRTAARDLDFNQDVQPILASRCFSCHGPDPEMRKAGLRLDLAEWALRKRPQHPDAIVPGHPEKSELVKRIESRDPHYLMPQVAQGEAKPMNAGEIATLREWIREGAVYRPHWAFEVPVRSSVPPPQTGAAWVKTPVDNFILAKLEKAGLHPSPEADRATLIRRVTLDLTGLLPTPGEVLAFVNDTSSDAYEHMVDGLLARPAFGEQRARYWLDYARYADTYGLHFDNSRDIWPYRDYVIRSFNANKPFDQFAMEQIAGDLLPMKTLDPLIGSGYVRLGVSSNEGGTIPEELRVNIARERTEAFGATFMGITVGCAVCHDHKFDPTTQHDFYALSAFFNNLDEKPFNDDRPVWAPVVRIPRAENQDAYNSVLAHRSELQGKFNAMRRNSHELIALWLASFKDAPRAVEPNGLVLRLRLDEGSEEELKNSAPNANPATFHTTTLKGEWGETTWLWPDFRMRSSTRVLLGQTGDYEEEQPFSSGGWFMFRSAPFHPGSFGTLLSKMDSTHHDRGWELSAEDGFVSVALANQMPKESIQKEQTKKSTKKEQRQKQPEAKEPFHYPSPQDLSKKDFAPNKPPEQKKAEDEAAKKGRAQEKKEEAEAKAKQYSTAGPPKDTTREVAIRVSSVTPLPLDGAWKHIFFTYDGSGRASGVKIYVNGTAIPTRVLSDDLSRATIRTPAPMQLGWRDPEEHPAKEARYQDIRLYARALSADEVGRLPFEDYVAEIATHPGSEWTADQWHVMSEFYLNHVDSSCQAIQREMVTLDQQLDQLSTGGDLTQVSWEKPSLAYAHVLTRGVYTARTDRVAADTPHFLPPLLPGETHNRLALAKWIVSATNPLTARVTVNRMWYELFGTGIVETTEDFGIMGQRPTHPELLDWLAVEFRENGWNIKHMYKLMVMSAVYRQSAKSNPQQLAKDPRNLLLSHGPRFRMDAEMLRDIALQSSGLLVEGIGGPSEKPYQPANIWEEVSYPSSDTVHYVQEHGDALYRRSMYTYVKRMASPPSMDAFDAPMRDVVCTRRQRTDTPLQALATMNDVQWVESARVLAQRVIHEAGPNPRRRINRMSELLLAHDAAAPMAAALEISLQQMQQHYAQDPKAARSLVEMGEKKRDPSIPEAELAAWTIVASEMLNLDETLNK